MPRQVALSLEEYELVALVVEHEVADVAVDQGWAWEWGRVRTRPRLPEAEVDAAGRPEALRTGSSRSLRVVRIVVRT